MATDVVYGISLALVEGDLVLTKSPDLALQMIGGVPNALQALLVRVLTPFGTDPFNGTYGLDVRQAFVEPNDIQTVRQLLKLSLVQTLATDPRVRDVRELLFKDDPGYSDRHPELSAAELAELVRKDRVSRNWTLDVILDLADAPAQSLTVKIGV